VNVLTAYSGTDHSSVIVEKLDAGVAPPEYKVNDELPPTAPAPFLFACC
jgi:hypothetical protein